MKKDDVCGEVNTEYETLSQILREKLYYPSFVHLLLMLKKTKMYIFENDENQSVKFLFFIFVYFIRDQIINLSIT